MIILIKIVTALGNPNLNIELRKYGEFQVLGKDIQYSDGIIEYLELNNDIDYIIISEFLEGEIPLINLVNCIYKINKKIKIIIILNEKNSQLEDQLIQKGVHDIFYNKSEIIEIINLLKTKNMEYLNKELRNEIEKLKEIILEKNNEKIKKKKKKNLKFNKENIKNKILGIIGSNGIGKTSFCYLISNILNKKYKILLVDFDLKNNDLLNLLKIKKEYIEKENISINDLIKNIKNNLDIISDLNFLINYKKYNINEIIFEINKIKNNYDFIIIDTNSNIFFDKNKEIYNLCDQLILLADVDRLEQNKKEKINNFLVNNLKINRNKITIILYKFKKIYYLFNRKNIKNTNEKIRINYILFWNKFLENYKLIKYNILLKKKIFLLIKKISEK